MTKEATRRMLGRIRGAGDMEKSVFDLGESAAVATLVELGGAQGGGIATERAPSGINRACPGRCR
jgi:hypothetical protein